MPYFLNTQTGLLEEAPQPQQGVHEYPLVDPDGNIGSASAENYQQLVAEGFRPPSNEEVKHQLDYAKHSTPVEQAKTFAEGAAKAATFGLSTGVERALGVDPEGIRKREEINPGTAVAGELTGFVGSALLPGAGALGAMTRAGEATAARVATSKLGQQMAKQATEMAMIQAGDEVSKAFAQHPDQTMQSVAANMGLSVALGAGFGLATDKILEPIWKVTKGAELTAFLSTMRQKAQGVSGANAIDDIAKAAGIELTPEMRAALSDNPQLKGMAQELREGSTKAAKSYQQSLEKLHRDASDQAITGLGKSIDDVARVAEISEYEEGVAAKKALEDELKLLNDPIVAKYEKINERFKGAVLPDGTLDTAAERINKMALDEGFLSLADSEAAAALGKINKSLTGVKDLEGLRQLQSGIRDELATKQLFGLQKKVGQILRDVEEKAVGDILGKEAPELLALHAEARSGYRALSDTIDSLNDRLRAGRYSGPGGFLRNLKEMAPEDVIRRLKGANDVELQKLLSTQFPGVAQAVRSYHVNQLLKKAVNAPRALEGGVDTRVLFKALDGVSPELRDFILTKEQQGVLQSVKGIVEKLPERMNPSGTGKAIDSMLSFPGGVGAVVSALLTGNPFSGYVLGHVGKMLSRDVPDAVKLGLLKFLGSEGPVEATAFKAMVDIAEKAYKSAKATERAVKGVTKASANAVIVPAPSPAKVIRLDEYLKRVEADPEMMLNEPGDMGVYLPEHAMAAGTLNGRAVQYLNSIRPKQEKTAPLDPPRKPNAIEEAKFERQLQIAEQPMLILQHVKDGTITPDDLKTLVNIYPDLYETYKERLMEGVLDASAEDKKLPYQTAYGLSLFLGIPLTSSLQPENILANQNLLPSLPPQPPQAVKPSQQGLKNLGEVSKAASTPSQARQLNRATRK